MDPSVPVSQALAVKDGCIVEIGGTDEILWLREDDYELIDLQGGTVVPGTVDASGAYTIRGTLAPGQSAGFLVLSDDPLATRPAESSGPFAWSKRGSVGDESWFDLDRPASGVLFVGALPRRRLSGSGRGTHASSHWIHWSWDHGTPHGPQSHQGRALARRPQP